MYKLNVKLTYAIKLNYLQQVKAHLIKCNNDQ